jgi:hypothetical protein
MHEQHWEATVYGGRGTQSPTSLRTTLSEELFAWPLVLLGARLKRTVPRDRDCFVVPALSHTLTDAQTVGFKMCTQTKQFKPMPQKTFRFQSLAPDPQERIL